LVFNGSDRADRRSRRRTRSRRAPRPLAPQQREWLSASLPRHAEAGRQHGSWPPIALAPPGGRGVADSPGSSACGATASEAAGANGRRRRPWSRALSPSSRAHIVPAHASNSRFAPHRGCGHRRFFAAAHGSTGRGSGVESASRESDDQAEVLASAVRSTRAGEVILPRGRVRRRL